VLAIVLYLVLGSRVALAELLAELLIGLLVLGGGGGRKRVRPAVRALLQF
jgi:hypothetical protein